MGFNYSPSSEQLTSFGRNAGFNVVIWQVPPSSRLQSLQVGYQELEQKPMIHNRMWHRVPGTLLGAPASALQSFVQMLICPTETYGVPTTRLAWLLLNHGEQGELRGKCPLWMLALL